VALVKAPTKQKTTTLQVRLEEDVRITLDKYAHFIDANPSYVVSEALKLLFKRDQEFKRWLGQRAKTDGQEHGEGAGLAKAASQT
jgi:predicted transcriptional regulator